MFTGAVASASSEEDDTGFSDCGYSEAEQDKEGCGNLHGGRDKTPEVPF